MTTPDQPAIARAARAALGDPQAEVLTSAHAPVSWQAIAPTTAELSRYSGTTADGRPWSAIRKVIRQAESRWHSDWRREAAVYVSGLPDGLPDGISAPRVYGIDEGEGEVALWLEDVVETVPVWPLSRYAVAARDLGRFNGAYLAGRPLPSAPTLSRDWLAGWVAMTGERGPQFLADPSVTGHQLVCEAVTPEQLLRLRALHAARSRLHAALDRLPATVSHLDAWRANLIARDRNGATETVAIDWSIVGLAPAGQELAIFVTGARVWLTLDAADAAQLGEVSYRSYLAGLRDAGWVGSEADVRLAYVASAALWAGIPAPLWLRWFTLPARRAWLERKFGMSLEAAARPFGAFIGDVLDLADEALAVAPA